jgi:hypothetical protein
MRRYMAATLIIALNIMLTQCDMDKTSLFSNFFTTVTHTANASDYFQHVDGERFFFYVMRADVINTDLAYVIQALPDGQRKLAVYNGVLQRITTATSPDFGSAHLVLDTDHHMVGRVECTIAAPATVTFVSDVAPNLMNPDGAIAFYAGDLYDFTMDNSVAVPLIQYLTYQYTGGADPFSVTGSGAATFPVGFNRPFALEKAASRGDEDTVFYLLRDMTTNAGYVAQTGFPPSIITPMSTYPTIRLVAGTARVCTGDQSFVVQADDGTLRRVFGDGNADTEVASSSYNDFLIAYPQNNTMYLFNPSSFTLFKGRTWWEYN